MHSSWGDRVEPRIETPLASCAARSLLPVTGAVNADNGKASVLNQSYQGKRGTQHRREAWLRPAGHSLPGMTNGAASLKRFSTLLVSRNTLLSYPFHDSEPAKAIEPVENTAPPFGVSKNVMSAWMSGLMMASVAPCGTSTSSATSS